MSLGVTLEGDVELQVVSVPPPAETSNLPDQSHTDEPSFILAASIPLNSDSGDIGFHCSDESASIYHQYKGREIGTIRIWIRDNFFLGSFSIFAIKMDLRGAPHTWFNPCPIQIEGREKPRYAVDHMRVTERQDTSTIMSTGTCGRRFFWWQDIHSPIKNLSTSTEAVQSTQLLLCSSDIDNSLPLPPSMGSPEPETNDAQIEVYSMGMQVYQEQRYFIRRYEGCMMYPTRRMECPYDFSFTGDRTESPIVSLTVDEWSGTVICMLTSGDIIVLRYGHS